MAQTIADTITVIREINCVSSNAAANNKRCMLKKLYLFIIYAACAYLIHYNNIIKFQTFCNRKTYHNNFNKVCQSFTKPSKEVLNHTNHKTKNKCKHTKKPSMVHEWKSLSSLIKSPDGSVLNESPIN